VASRRHHRHLRPRAELFAQLECHFARAFAAASSDAWERQFGWRLKPDAPEPPGAPRSPATTPEDRSTAVEGEGRTM
jgi:hypothetical protein